MRRGTRSELWAPNQQSLAELVEDADDKLFSQVGPYYTIIIGALVVTFAMLRRLILVLLITRT